jgi:Uma2 family endonuclease
MASLPTISPEEYLIRDRANAYKSEYCLGRMYAMAGASDRHNVINTNINAALFVKLREIGCRPASSDQRVYAHARPFFAYPDTVVTCGPKEFLPDERKDTLVNPVLIFEVLSDSTREYDLGLKFAMYKTIPSLREYIAIEHDSVHIYHWESVSSAEWTKREYASVRDTISLLSVGIDLPVEDVYLDAFVE